MFKNFMKIFQKPVEVFSTPVVAEFEVYFPGTYDSTTNFAYVAFTGTEEECNDFVSNYEDSKHISVRPTGQMTTITI